MRIVFPPLTEWQAPVFDYLHNARRSGRVAVVKSRRQCGKSLISSVLLISYAVQSPCISIYISPTLKQSRLMYKAIKRMLRNTHLITEANGTDLNIELWNGSELHFRSTGQGDGIRGERCSGMLVIDEAAFCDDETIFDVLPVINVHKAPLLIISTPMFTDGYFYDMFMLGAAGGAVQSFDWGQYDTSRFLTAEQRELYRQTMSRNKFRSEILGEFITNDGLLFTGINECVYEPSAVDTKDELLYIGIDFATGVEADYTVITGVNARGEQVFVKRVNNLTPSAQIDWLASEISQRKVAKILAEKNSIGRVYIDQLQQKISVPITNWTTTNKSKHEIVTELQTAIENRRIGLLSDTIQLDELRKFQAVVNPATRNVKYAAAKGHDDSVIALCLAWRCLNGSRGNYKLGFV